MEQQPDSRRGADRRYLLVCALLLIAAFAARAHNTLLFPPLRDYDGIGHALNIVSVREGRIPDPRSWSGFHPPLYYAVAALVWQLTPQGLPAHVVFRWVSLAVGLLALAATWRFLRPRVGDVDATIVVTLVACSGVVTVATSMLGNETTCALFATLALTRSASVQDRRLRSALPAALLCALAAGAKATGWVVTAVVALAEAARRRRSPQRALAAAALVMGVPLLALAPYYAVALHGANAAPISLVTGASLSPDAAAMMATQPPGTRALDDYLTFPLDALLSPSIDRPSLQLSVWGLLYASTWADGHGQFLPPGNPSVRRANEALALGGLLPTALAMLGAALVVVRRQATAWARLPLAFFVVLLAAFVRYTWVIPHCSAVKASYLLSALLPGSIFLALGLGALGPRFRTVARGALLVFSAASAGTFWLGAWVR